MKRNKDEKLMGPMFPRLHVNDTDKGGPRAPPRNKMALYEQFSIPSQRFSHPSLPPKQNSVATNSVIQSRQVPAKHSIEKQCDQQSDLRISLSQVEPRKKLDDDDYRVPIFVNTTSGQEFNKMSSNMECQRISTSNPHCFYMEEEGEIRKGRKSKEFVGERSDDVSNSSSIGKTEGPKKQMVSSRFHVPGNNSSDTVHRSNIKNYYSNSVFVEKVSKVGNISSTNSGNESKNQSSVRDRGNSTRCVENRCLKQIQTGNLDRDDSRSETSILDTVSGLDIITPDDVVGVIGQKQFWNARRAIANQQRVFSVQVFELHRLIKVQKLIAASPHLLFEDSTYLSMPLMSLPEKKISLDYPAKSITTVSQQKASSDHLARKEEASAENTVEKAPNSPAQNEGQPSRRRPLRENTQAPPPAMSNDPHVSPLCFNQLPGHQWLIPVMSPSEGLVYKPYQVPFYTGQACGNGDPRGSNPTMGNFFPLPYGVPAPPTQYPMSFPSVEQVGPNGYFPSYGMPMVTTPAFSNSSVDQEKNPPAPGHYPAGETSFIIQQQNMFAMPSQNNSTIPVGQKTRRPCEDTEVQASTASSTCEIQASRASYGLEGRSMLPLFPTSPAANASSPGSKLPGLERPIKVVPHNAMSASESAARIFRSIQEERKQQDSE